MIGLFLEGPLVVIQQIKHLHVLAPQVLTFGLEVLIYFFGHFVDQLARILNRNCAFATHFIVLSGHDVLNAVLEERLDTLNRKELVSGYFPHHIEELNLRHLHLLRILEVQVDVLNQVVDSVEALLFCGYLIGFSTTVEVETLILVDPVVEVLLYGASYLVEVGPFILAVQKGVVVKRKVGLTAN